MAKLPKEGDILKHRSEDRYAYVFAYNRKGFHNGGTIYLDHYENGVRDNQYETNGSWKTINQDWKLPKNQEELKLTFK